MNSGNDKYVKISSLQIKELVDEMLKQFINKLPCSYLSV